MLRGFLSTWVGLIINGVVGILLTPVLVHGLGPFYYGLWILVASVLDYYGLLDMGMRYSLQRFTARYGGANERQALNETFMTGLSVSVFVCTAVVFIVPVLMYFLPGFFKLQGEAVRLFQLLLALQGATLILSFPARVMGAYMCGLRRFDLYNGLASAQGLLKGLILWLIIRMHGGIKGVAVAQLAIAAAILVFSWIATRMTDPQLSVHWHHTNWARTKELASFSFYVFLNDIGDRLRFFTDAVVIAHVLTVALTTPFNVIGKIMEMFRMMFYPITGPLTTEANALEGQSKIAELKRLFLRSTKMCTVLAWAVTIVLVAHGRDVLRVWMGESFTPYYSLLVILTIGYCVILMQAPSTIFLYARSRHKILGVWTLVEGLLNLGLSIYWAKQYGLVGVALGTTVPMLIIRLGIQPFWTFKVLDLSWGAYLAKSILRPFIVTALVLGGAWITGLLRPTTDLLGLAGAVAGIGMLFIPLSYWIVFDAQERQSLRQRGALLMGRILPQRA
jgi:O-antigen/teichoic acid export membrane protein